MPLLDLHCMYEAYDRIDSQRNRTENDRKRRRTTIERYTGRGDIKSEGNGFKRLAMCRMALEAMDRRGWERSFHQVHCFILLFLFTCFMTQSSTEVLPRPLPEGVCEGHVEDRACRDVRAGPSAHPRDQWVGLAQPRDPRIHATEVRLFYFRRPMHSFTCASHSLMASSRRGSSFSL